MLTKMLLMSHVPKVINQLFAGSLQSPLAASPAESCVAFILTIIFFRNSGNGGTILPIFSKMLALLHQHIPYYHQRTLNTG